MRHLVFVFVGLSVLFSFVAMAATNFQTAGTVKSIRGSALAVQNAQVRPLKIGDEVFIGDILSTGTDSRLEITMIDEGSFKLGASTSFVVIDYTFGQGDSNAVLELLNGALDGVSGQISKVNPKGMKIVAKTATIGIRGTKYFVGEVDGNLSVAHWAGGGVLVQNQHGEVYLGNDNVGTDLHEDQAPTAVQSWDGHKKQRAKALVD